MFCPHCGNSLPDGARFCINCGSQVKPDAPAAVEQQVPPPQQAWQPQPQQTWDPQPQQNWQPQQPQQSWDPQPQQPQQSWDPQPQQTWQTPQQSWQPQPQQSWQSQQQARQEPYAAPSVQPVPVTPKSKKKLTAILISAGAILVVAALILAFFTPLSNFFRRTVSSPESYYQYVEKRSSSKLSDDAGDYYEAFVPAQETLSGRSLDAELTLTLGDGLKQLLADSAQMDLDWFKDASVHVTSALGEDLGSANVDLSINGKQIINADGILDLEKLELLCRIPMFSSEYFRAPLEDVGYMMPADLDELLESEEFNQYQKILDAMPKDDQVRKLIERYSGLITKQIETVEKGEQTIEVQGVSQKCTKLTATIDNETMLKIVKAVGEELLEDKDVEKIVVNMASALGEMSGEEDADYGKEVYEEMLEKIRELLDEAENSEEEIDNVESVVFVDNSGKVIGRVLQLQDNVLEYLRPEDGEKFGLRLNVISDYASFTLTGDGLDRSGKIFGNFVLEYEGEELATIEIEDFDKDGLKDGELKGAFTVTPSASLLQSGSVDIPIPDLALRIEADCEEDKADLTISVLQKDNVYLTLAAKIRLGHDDPSVKTAPQALDMEEWSSSIDSENAMQELYDAFENAGVPEDVLNSAGTMLTGGYTDDDYDYDWE